MPKPTKKQKGGDLDVVKKNVKKGFRDLILKAMKTSCRLLNDRNYKYILNLSVAKTHPDVKRHWFCPAKRSSHSSKEYVKYY